MADAFDIALAFVIHHEGGFVNHSDDPGGATKYGLSLRTVTAKAGDAPGWLRFFDKNNDGKVDATDVELFSIDDAGIYYERLWKRRRLDEIRDPLIAAKIFDMIVVSGFGGGSRVAQRAIRAVEPSLRVVEDGAMGPVTIKALNALRDDWLMVALCSEAAGFFRDLDKPQFEEGWLNRAYNKPNKEMNYA